MSAVPPTAAASWRTWHARCALGLCDPWVQAELRTYIWNQFRRYVLRFETRTQAGPAAVLDALGPRDAWHLFETHAAVGRDRAAKRYKDWMARFEPLHDRTPADGWQHAASLLMRDVVREHLRREYSPHRTLDAGQEAALPAAACADPCAPIDALEPRTATDARAYAEVAAILAQALFDDLSDRARSVLLARVHGVLPSSEALRRHLGVGRSALYDTLRGVMSGIADACREAYPGEPDESLYCLATHVYDALAARCRAWGVESVPGAAVVAALRGVCAEQPA